MWTRVRQVREVRAEAPIRSLLAGILLRAREDAVALAQHHIPDAILCGVKEGDVSDETLTYIFRRELENLKRFVASDWFTDLCEVLGVDSRRLRLHYTRLLEEAEGVGKVRRRKGKQQAAVSDQQSAVSGLIADC